MATILVDYPATTAPTAAQQADIEEAAIQWSNAIADDLEIRIEVVAMPLMNGHNAMCIPGIVQHGGRTLTRAQAKLLDVPIVYADADTGRLDMVILIDDATPWVTGWSPAPLVGFGRFSLLTTMLHEMCHGFGLLGLCNVGQDPDVGIYSDTGLTALLPQAVVPPGFFPASLQSGVDWITPFASLFTYPGGPQLVKGNPENDFEAFTGAPGSVVIPHVAGSYTILTTSDHFVPFTSCDHLVGTEPDSRLPFLMSSSTSGQSIMAPDRSSRALLNAIGWNC